MKYTSCIWAKINGNRLFTFGIAASVAYIGFVGWIRLGDDAPDDIVGSLRALTLSDLGNLLAGLFAPLAFLWFFVATMLQSEELGLQRRQIHDLHTRVLKFQVRPRIQGGKRWLEVVAANAGLRPVFIEKVGLRFADGTVIDRATNPSKDSENLWPVLRTEGEREHWWILEDELAEAIRVHAKEDARFGPFATDTVGNDYHAELMDLVAARRGSWL